MQCMYVESSSETGANPIWLMGRPWRVPTFPEGINIKCRLPVIAHVEPARNLHPCENHVLGPTIKELHLKQQKVKHA